MLTNINPEKLNSWNELLELYNENKDRSLIDFFELEKDRNYLRKSWNDFYLDFSKTHISKEILNSFKSLHSEIKLNESKNSMFNGEHINQTEDRAVLHTALRNFTDEFLIVDGKNILADVRDELESIKDFSYNLHSGELVGYTGKKINTIVNIGIGGSDLGPFMVTTALKPYWQADITPLFVSNIDANDILEKLDQCDPETTLFIIASKTFTTQETMTNAHSARNWFLERAKDEKYIKNHFVAVSTNKEKVTEFGIDPENMFVFWDWVGGRYSLWSAIGLSIACTIGYSNFEDLLLGAEAMDKHFRESKFEDNLPVLLACIGIWYNNFHGSETHAILPYDHRLSHFSRYLQQGDMESNGKYIDRNGKKIDHQSGQIIWGEPGTNGQHAFYQLIHQGTKLIPCDFIGIAKPSHALIDHQQKLLSNFFAQTEALMNGKSESVVREELKKAGKSEPEIDKIAPFKVFEGNNPTISILIKELTPKNLGSLIALYEHKIFIQGIIWNIFSFDQWGVELGKQLAGKILPEIQKGEITNPHDESTSSLLKKYFDMIKD